MPQLIDEFLLDAVATVSAWEVPEEDFANIVNVQARLMAGGTTEDTGNEDAETPRQT